jgi:ribonuclease HI
MINEPHRTLRIWQQNTRKSLPAQLLTLHAVKNSYDIICIQEPHFDHLNATRATPVWRLITPTGWNRSDPADKMPRAIILVHERIPTNSWTQVNIESLDVVGIKVVGEGGEITIYNIYNDCTHSDTLTKLQDHLEARDRANPDPNIGDKTIGDIWLGDFNRHHPLWDDEENDRLFTHQNLNDAGTLIDLLADHDMHMVLPHGIPTIRNAAGNLTRPDNVFASSHLIEWIINCDTRPDEQPPTADHFPIATILDFPVTTNPPHTPRNFRATDWQELKDILDDELMDLEPPREINSREELLNALDKLEAAIMRTIDQAVPKKKPSPYAKRWWTKELEMARKKVRKLGRQARHYERYPAHSIHNEWKNARNELTMLLRKTKRDHYNDWIESINAGNIWDAHRFAMAPVTDGAKTRIPVLKKIDVDGQQTEVQDNEGKSKLLHKSFFYDPPADSGIDPNYQYPEPAFQFERITDDEVKRAIKKLSPYKAPGPNEISNSVLTHCVNELTPFIGPIYRAVFAHKHYPTKWKRYTTVVLRKAGRTDYTNPGSYRPIALLDTIAKVLASIVKDKIQFHTEKLQLLPQMQFGGRPGCSATDSLHMLTGFIKDAWRRRQGVLVLFLDVKGAFPNTVPEVLAHDMRRYGVPKEYTDMILDKMSGRETIIAFDDYKSNPIPVNNGLDQGCNLAMYGYRFYNASQIEGSIGKKDELATNFADDAACATSARTLEEAAEKMKTLFQREGGPALWGQTHFSVYEFRKFAAMWMTRARKEITDPDGRKRRIKTPPTKIQIDDEHEVTTTTSHKFLGVLLDDELRFQKHAAYAIGKGERWISQVRRLSKVARGMHGTFARKLYYSVAIPSMLYAADVWCPQTQNTSGSRKKNGMKAAIRKMETIQRKAALKSTGALRTTPSDLLFIHANMLPLRSLIKLICQRSALRIASLPKQHPLYATARKAMGRRLKRHTSALYDILHQAKIRNNPIESIDTISKPPTWRNKVKVVLAKTREEAEQLINNDESDIKIFTDGSSHDGGVGASAVLIQGIRPARIARHYLGKDIRHTVYESECVGQIIALKMLQNLGQDLNGTEITIATDNQAVLRSYSARKPTPGSYLIEDARALIESIEKKWPRIKLKLQWVPGHEGIEGNEKADTEAKRAAEGEHKNRRNEHHRLLKGLPASKSATKQHLKRKVWKEYERGFRKSLRYERATRIDPKAPTSNFAKIAAKLTRQQASILVQLRTGHVPLQAYLYRFKLVETATCPSCGIKPETVTHFMLHCVSYVAQRRRLRRALGRDQSLGLEILGDAKNIKVFMNYVHSTKRFEESHGDLHHAGQEDD